MLSGLFQCPFIWCTICLPVVRIHLRERKGWTIHFPPQKQKTSLLSSSDPHLETLFWHSLWHAIWKCIWHNYIYSIHSDLLSDTLSGLYSDISGIYSDILSGIKYSDILSGILSGISSEILCGRHVAVTRYCRGRQFCRKFSIQPLGIDMRDGEASVKRKLLALHYFLKKILRLLSRIPATAQHRSCGSSQTL